MLRQSVISNARIRPIAFALATARSLVCLALVFTLIGCGENRPNPSPPSKQPAPPVAAPQSAAKVEPPPTPSAHWPTYHGSTSLDGVADVAFPDALAQAWQFDAGAPIENPPVASKDRICFANGRGVIFALDMNGQQQWSKTFTEPLGEGKQPRTIYFDAPLVLIDSTLIAGSASGTIYALDAATGDIRWQCETKVPILGSPNVADVIVDGVPRKRVFVIDESEGALQCIDFDTGALLWSGDTVTRCDGSPATNGSVVVYGSCAAALHVFSAADGKLLRETPLNDESQVAGGVVLLGDSIFSGSRSGIFIHANAQTGATEWINKDCEGESYSTPAVSADVIVFGADDSVLYALDRKSGALKWKQELDDTPSSPVIARDKILVTADGALHMLRLSDGEKLWSFSVSDVVTSPSIAGALVLVGSDDGSLTAFRGKEGA